MNNMNPFRMTANPTLPKFYWEVKSQEQLIKFLCSYIVQLGEYANEQTEQINTNTGDIDSMQTVIDSISNGEYTDKYIDGLAQYIDDNLIKFVSRLTAYVFPGFYWDGTCWRYMLTVPSDWSFLRFTYVWCEDGTYHLTLQY